MPATRSTEPRRPGNSKRRSRRSLFALAVRSRWLLGLVLAVPFLLGADDDFLREIEEEAKRQANLLITSQSPSTPTAPTTPSDAGDDRLAAGLDPAAFEQALRQRSPDVYSIYQQLDTSRKQQAYQAYQKDSQLTSISERVTQLRGSKP